MQISQFYKYYTKHCTQNCMDFNEFQYHFPQFWQTIGATMMINGQMVNDDIPYLLNNGKSVRLNQQEIIQKVMKNA